MKQVGNANRVRNQAMINLINFLQETYPFKKTEPSGYGFADDEDAERTALEAYKESKRVRLLVNGNVLEDLTLAEHEHLAVLNGDDPKQPVEFRIELGGEKQENVLNFPAN